MKNIVTVTSKSTNNCSVPVVFQTVKMVVDGQEETRFLSRSYVFRNFEAQMPLKMARALTKEQPDEFYITDVIGEIEEDADELLKKEKERMKGFKCPVCGFPSKTKAGYSAHMRAKHNK